MLPGDPRKTSTGHRKQHTREPPSTRNCSPGTDPGFIFSAFLFLRHVSGILSADRLQDRHQRHNSSTTKTIVSLTLNQYPVGENRERLFLTPGEKENQRTPKNCKILYIRNKYIYFYILGFYRNSTRETSSPWSKNRSREPLEILENLGNWIMLMIMSCYCQQIREPKPGTASRDGSKTLEAGATFKQPGSFPLRSGKLALPLVP